mmetsp:Transcript_10456/g.36757  ORF Transcript_10456/g.36757 Transcript_10456/m.36757 type:complete len:223 (+) Transcript_10456:440-1108(+)
MRRRPHRAACKPRAKRSRAPSRAVSSRRRKCRGRDATHNGCATRRSSSSSATRRPSRRPSMLSAAAATWAAAWAAAWAATSASASSWSVATAPLWWWPATQDPTDGRRARGGGRTRGANPPQWGAAARAASVHPRAASSPTSSRRHPTCLGTFAYAVGVASALWCRGGQHRLPSPSNGGDVGCGGTAGSGSGRSLQYSPCRSGESCGRCVSCRCRTSDAHEA